MQVSHLLVQFPMIIKSSPITLVLEQLFSLLMSVVSPLEVALLHFYPLAGYCLSHHQRIVQLVTRSDHLRTSASVSFSWELSDDKVV